ncbi:MAG: phosphonate C-P lyase system protein PhnH [Actinomycetota bacterium]|nr:phosphonate C-P lyase system protein PhnH [Actinomycetota bacterium]
MSWDVVHDSRAVFRACLSAQCRPGDTVGPVPRAGLATDPTLDTVAAVLVSLLDDHLTLAAPFGGAVGSVAEAIRAVTGAGCASVGDADFVLVTPGGLAVASRARRGTAHEPELGATLIACHGPGRTNVELSGPGLAEPAHTTLPLAADELWALSVANSSPPAGVDVFLVGPSGVTAIPRSTTIVEERR